MVRYEDYLTGVAVEHGAKRALTLPSSNVLRYLLEGGTTISIRPSGTEPKCKIYFGILATEKEKAEQLLTLIHDDLKKILI